MNEPIGERNIDTAGDLHNQADWPEQLAAYIDQELDVATTRQIVAHLAVCARCQAEVKATQLLKTELAGLPQLVVPRSFAITPAQARRLNPPPLYTAARIALGLAAALLIFVFGLDFLGLANQTTQTNIAVLPVATATPDYVVPPIGTRPACGPASGQGNVICSGGDPGTTVRTATSPSSIQLVVTTSGPSAAVHIAEIALVALVLAMAAFALAVRPRAPTKPRF